MTFKAASKLTEKMRKPNMRRLFAAAALMVVGVSMGGCAGGVAQNYQPASASAAAERLQVHCMRGSAAEFWAHEEKAGGGYFLHGTLQLNTGSLVGYTTSLSSDSTAGPNYIRGGGMTDGRVTRISGIYNSLGNNTGPRAQLNFSMQGVVNGDAIVDLVGKVSSEARNRYQDMLATDETCQYLAGKRFNVGGEPLLIGLNGNVLVRYPTVPVYIPTPPSVFPN